MAADSLPAGAPIYCHNCDEAAYTLTREVRRGELMTADSVRYHDGTQPEKGDRIQCKRCGSYASGTLISDDGLSGRLVP